jgi:hypothetical protein
VQVTGLLEAIMPLCRTLEERLLVQQIILWPAPGSADTELGVLMEPEVSHGKAEVYTRVQA